MKFHARSCFLSFSILLLFGSLASAQCHCKCRPSPPGGTTQCESGDIAICSSGDDGTCHGSCIHVPRQTKALDLTATVFTKLFNQEISTSQILENRQAAETVIDRLIESSTLDKTVTVTYGSRRFTLSVGLSESAMTLLKSAKAQLSPFQFQ